ncbi:MAG: PilZ domain-containing protein [Caulobacteraceae bacterium]
MTSATLPGPIDDPDADCRRRARRQRVLFGGKIVLGPNLSMDCTIRNLSEGGAQVRIGIEVGLPNEFHLIEIRSAMAYRVRVAWRSASATGVKFTERLDLNRTDAPLHLRQLWLGCATRGAHLHDDA